MCHDMSTNEAYYMYIYTLSNNYVLFYFFRLCKWISSFFMQYWINFILFFLLDIYIFVWFLFSLIYDKISIVCLKLKVSHTCWYQCIYLKLLFFFLLYFSSNWSRRCMESTKWPSAYYESKVIIFIFNFYFSLY